MITGTFTYIANPSLTRNIPNENVYLKCDTSSGPVTINLCQIAALKGFNNVKIFVVDETGNAATNNITINAFAGDKIDGATSKVINTNEGAVEIQVADSNSWLCLEGDVVVPVAGAKEFLATIHQTGEGAPVLTVVKNTIGGTPVLQFAGSPNKWKVNFQANVLPPDTQLVKASNGAFAGFFNVEIGGNITSASQIAYTRISASELEVFAFIMGGPALGGVMSNAPISLFIP